MLTKRIGIFSAIAVLAVSFLPVSDVQALEKPIGILLAAGDIATCADDETKSGKATAELVKAEIARAKAIDPNLEVRVLALGDLAYDRGTTGAFNCFNATWGQFTRSCPCPVTTTTRQTAAQLISNTSKPRSRR